MFGSIWGTIKNLGNRISDYGAWAYKHPFKAIAVTVASGIICAGAVALAPVTGGASVAVGIGSFVAAHSVGSHVAVESYRDSITIAQQAKIIQQMQATKVKDAQDIQLLNQKSSYDQEIKANLQDLLDLSEKKYKELEAREKQAAAQSVKDQPKANTTTADMLNQLGGEKETASSAPEPVPVISQTKTEELPSSLTRRRTSLREREKRAVIKSSIALV